MKKFLILSIFLIILTTIFAIQNSENTIVQFLFFKINIPLALVIIISLTIGIIIGFLLNIVSNKKKSLNKENKNI